MSTSSRSITLSAGANQGLLDTDTVVAVQAFILPQQYIAYCHISPNEECFCHSGEVFADCCGSIDRILH
jgi:hypothetical protein